MSKPVLYLSVRDARNFADLVEFTHLATALGYPDTSSIEVSGVNGITLAAPLDDLPFAEV